MHWQGKNCLLGGLRFDRVVCFKDTQIARHNTAIATVFQLIRHGLTFNKNF
jgi:hypothetical protein